MPLDATRATSKVESINDAFANLGWDGATLMPRAKGSRTVLNAAWEYFVASHALRIAETRRKRAHAEAVQAGVLIDHETDPEPVGTNRVVYAGPVVEITLTVAAPIEGVDHAAFVVDLLKAGVKPALVDRLTKKHATETRPAHKFTASLRAG